MDFPDLKRLPAELRIRNYQPADFDACSAIYHSNLNGFLPDTPELFIKYLSKPPRHYLVIESSGAIVACGGLETRSDINASAFAFGMVHREFHHRGLGSLLVLTRLALFDGEHDPISVSMETTVTVEAFYRQFGFYRTSAPEYKYPGAAKYLSMSRWLYMEDRDSIRHYLAGLPVTFDFEFSNVEGVEPDWSKYPPP